MSEETQYRLRNLTAKRLAIQMRGSHVLYLPPLGQRILNLNEEEKRGYFDLWESAGAIGISEVKNEGLKLDWVPGVAIACGFVFAVAGGVLSDDVPQAFPWYWTLGSPLLVVSFLIGVLVYAMSRNLPDWRQRVTQYFVQWLSLVVTLLIGIGLPAVAIIYLGFGGLEEAIRAGSNLSLESLAWGLLLLFIVLASLLPGLLFYLFDRLRLGTLRERFYRQILRLDPYIHTMHDVQAKFGGEIEEVYGKPEGDGWSVPEAGGRLLTGSRWPLLLATAVFAMGWVLTLVPLEDNAGNGPSTNLLILFRPSPEPMVFAFLGAYFFSLNHVLRRYVRGDLRPKAYTSMAVRVIVVVILAWVLELIFQGQGSVYLLVTAFTVGFFPESGLILIGEFLQARNWRFNPYRESQPLTDLEGIDIYDRARLLDEGVTNIESLAHGELIDLLLQTRIPAPRLIDWVDQAILFLHVGPDNRVLLRKLGIRTATKLEEVYSKEPESLQGLKWIAPTVASLRQDEWMPHIRQWRASLLYDEVVNSPRDLYLPRPTIAQPGLIG